jgi:protein-disulfide isomerase
MALYNEILPAFRQAGAQLVGISVDGVWRHAAFGEARRLRFPLLADFEPKGAVARDYGVDEKIRRDFTGGVRSGVNGTPSLFLNGLRYDGPRDVASLVAAANEVAEAG